MVTIRNFRPDDIVAYVQLVNEIDAVDKQAKATSVRHLKERLELPGYYPEEDLFLAEIDECLVGYANIVRELGINRVILDGAVHPAHRGQGIGSQLLETALAHSRQLGTELVQIPITHRMPSAEQFVRKRGFRIVRRQWRMSLTCGEEPVPRPPRGFALSHFVPGDEASLCALQNLTFTGSWGFRPNTVAEVRYLVNTSYCHPEGILFLSKGEGKIGYCWTMEHPTDKSKGYIHMMGVAPAYQHRGLGRVLLLAGIGYLRQLGKREIQLLVDSQNTSAIHLYRSLGFQRRDTIRWYQKRLRGG